MDLGNGKYSTIRIEYPWVPQNYSLCKIFGHSRLKCHGIVHDTGYVRVAGFTSGRGPVSDVANIGDLVTTPTKSGTVEYRKVKGADSPTKLTNNTFESLAICEEGGALDITVVLSLTLVDVVSPLSGI